MHVVRERPRLGLETPRIRFVGAIRQASYPPSPASRDSITAQPPQQARAAPSAWPPAGIRARPPPPPRSVWPRRQRPGQWTGWDGDHHQGTDHRVNRFPEPGPLAVPGLQKQNSPHCARPTPGSRRVSPRRPAITAARHLHGLGSGQARHTPHSVMNRGGGMAAARAAWGTGVFPKNASILSQPKKAPDFSEARYLAWLHNLLDIKNIRWLPLSQATIFPECPEESKIGPCHGRSSENAS